MKKIFLMFLFSLQFFVLAESSITLKHCDLHLMDSLSLTDRFISYLGILCDEGIIDNQALEKMVGELEQNQLGNPLTIRKVETSSALGIHRENLQRYLSQGTLDQRKILVWARTVLKNQRSAQQARQGTINKTQSTYQEMQFNIIPPGKMLVRTLGDNGNMIESTIVFSHPFEVMSTKVTQKMWVDEMGFNPSQFSKEDVIAISIEGRSVLLSPNHPVDFVNWWSAATFANRLSKKMGYQPAYDLSQIQWDPKTSAEKGNLRPLETADAKKLRIDPNSTSINEADGYRLGTCKERQYFMRDLGRLPHGGLPTGISKQELMSYSWLEGNSSSQTHAVGTTAAHFIINGNNFYDLIGNIYEWCDDLHPLVKKKMGGDFEKPVTSWVFATDYAEPDNPSMFSDGRIGFRLFRTVKMK